MQPSRNRSATGPTHREHMENLPTLTSLLRRDASLADISPDDLEPVASTLRERHLLAGDVLIHEGAPGREAYLITEGELQLTVNGRPVDVVGVGDFVGELALLVHGPRSCTATAKTDACVIVIGAREFATLMHRPAIHWKITTSLVRRLRRALGSPTYD
jgi:CRP-like cAMP-binding protein